MTNHHGDATINLSMNLSCEHTAIGASFDNARRACCDHNDKEFLRGSSFTTSKDEAVVKAWVRVSEDAIVGSDQRGDAFYKAINELYKTLKPWYVQKRNNRLVVRPLRKILSECLSFSASVAKVSNCQPSGTNTADVIHLATSMFNKMEVASTKEDSGPPFKFLSCWSILKDHSKFDLLLNVLWE